MAGYSQWCLNELNSEQSVQVSDTTVAGNSALAGDIKQKRHLSYTNSTILKTQNLEESV
jgi:hypothetical protein